MRYDVAKNVTVSLAELSAISVAPEAPIIEHSHNTSAL